MALAVIGAGFGRTGTLSLKLALERLGLGPCYHMLEVFEHPEHARLWSAAADGTATPWDELFDGYAATVDWPGAYFWRALVARYPEAKVLLSVRDAEPWYQSIHDTIHQVSTGDVAGGDPATLERRETVYALARKIVFHGTFGGRLGERDQAIRIYEQHNAAVQDAVAPDRLLVYEVASGWPPLCDYLGVAVPDEPFPRVNTTAEFQARHMAPQT
jgi:hypothetical protein